jgi:hypothetical protein
MPFSPSTWHFDIDQYLNPLLPTSILSQLPYPISHFLGYRSGPPRSLGNIVIASWAFTGVFCSLSLVEAVTRQVKAFQELGSPIIIGSLVGALL